MVRNSSVAFIVASNAVGRKRNDAPIASSRLRSSFPVGSPRVYRAPLGAQTADPADGGERNDHPARLPDRCGQRGASGALGNGDLWPS